MKSVLLKNPEYADKLAKIRRQFKTGLIEKEIRLNKLKSKLHIHNKSEMQEVLLEIKTIAHNIVGIANNVGYGDIGKSAKKLQTCCVYFLQNYEEFNPVNYEELRIPLNQLIVAINASD
ncbi:hypothetical protein [Aliikangiella coralliicola]|uniref:HPt domain-containing protein n=1 Tax=Aliikangiella coralliicola TaxID=2592383 RepID=A0A545UES2_9GAMM|nr:hypothetical protein [Aliikangiella coralliicola]TQV87976.1 hypothetical protein FLL46_09175 [Aliikangiella coralliicola]